MQQKKKKSTHFAVKTKDACFIAQITYIYIDTNSHFYFDVLLDAIANYGVILQRELEGYECI